MNLGITELIIILLMCLPAIVLVAIAIFLVLRRRDLFPGQRVKCPHCAEWIMPEAKVCRYCGREIYPAPEPGND